MKNILIVTLLFISTLGVSQSTLETPSSKLDLDSLYLNSAFNDNPELTLYGINHGYEAAWLLDEQQQLINRLDVYRKKGNTRKWIGGGMMGLGLGGLWLTSEMDDLIYLTNPDNPNDPDVIANNEEADDQKRKRKLVAWPSALIAGAGAIIFVDSFKFNKWTQLELGLANIKITQAIYGGSSGRKYFRGKNKDLKNKSIYRKSYPKYHQ